MAARATITFSQPGVQPPVYVTTSLNDWTLVQMQPLHDKTASGDLIFSREFTGVAEGSHQYKIRVGEDHWVLDESKETAAVDQGIRNNLVHVKPASECTSLRPVSEATTNTAALETSPGNPSKMPEDRKDSTINQEQLAYDQIHYAHLPEHVAKRAADSESDLEGTKVDSPVETAAPKTPEIPLLVVDKTDRRPAYGDDFGAGATTAQKAAHDMRAADSLPDQLNIVPESHTEPESDDGEAAPLFRHESFQADHDPQIAPAIIIDDESAPSSTDQTSSGEAIDTPSEPDDSDELHLAPLLSHETGFENGGAGLSDGPHFSHGTDNDDDDDDDDDFGGAPLLPHETGFHDDGRIPTESENDEDELDRYPLLSHESGFSDYRGSEIVTKSDNSGISEPCHYGAYEDDEDDYAENEEGDAPLLPHEREASAVSSTGSVFSEDDTPFSLDKQPTFGYETDNARELFGGAGRHDFFRGRTGSNLPHRLPQSDAEDHDLNDPSLERFPTSRQSILERVATIGMHLPEDESMHERPHSPQPSVLSQACSSVDLVPVKSYTSLASVPEDEFSDEEEDHHDLDSMPSPVYISHNTTRMSSPPARFVRDPYATPLPDESKQLGYAVDTKHDESSNHTHESSEAESVDKHDGAKDVSRASNALRDAITTSVNTEKPAMDQVTSEPKATAAGAHPVAGPDSDLRQRRLLVEDSSETSEDATSAVVDGVSIKDKIVEAAKPALAQRPNHHNENFLQHFFRVMFGPVGHLMTACFGDRKRAR
ncbi:hypothetical protein J4E93_001838 [Alternaria ventricosa]|uniref:uncharacterized protein n=1 Tax=Alternaria ventricosa TaxID=1187951 RepID=UPI0020C391A7|nr:uncharacterized protein J4E93_001838 [Alternaria ventricosa]KAI4654069.1 hypothetical protein J4E93_001838 [Alternaria ventricosa]